MDPVDPDPDSDSQHCLKITWNWNFKKNYGKKTFYGQPKADVARWLYDLFVF